MKSTPSLIPFNRPYLTGRELSYISEAHLNGQLSGDGPFTKRCERWLEEFGTNRALLTHSCTAALEMAAILCDIKPGDEVIMPSYTFVSTANAFVLRGAKPVFVDIRRDTLNIDETKIEAAITSRTRVIVPVHYGGFPCEMDTIMAIANRHNLYVVEDAAQACMAKYKGRALGTIGHFGCYSFHETKNIICGEGGALLINRKRFVERAEVLREKGTNRSNFLRGKADKYTWHDIGSSFLPGEISAAFLWAQMQSAGELTKRRLALWNFYAQYFHRYIDENEPSRVESNLVHNGHIFFLMCRPSVDVYAIITKMREQGVCATTHYVPLHTSPYFRSNFANSPSMPVTEAAARRLIRLPIYTSLTQDECEKVCSVAERVMFPRKCLETNKARVKSRKDVFALGAGAPPSLGNESTKLAARVSRAAA